jgi:hypothetical protein
MHYGVVREELANCRRAAKAVAVLIALILPELGGCAIYSYRPVDVKVIDAESEQPIADANVWVGYVSMFVFNAPTQHSVTTDSAGRATIPVANFRGTVWGFGARGYLPTDAYSQSNDRLPHQGCPTFDQPTGREATIRLYRGPKPTITVIVPNGYRGPLWVHRRPAARWIQDTKGKRDFIYHAAADGYVRIDATRLLLESVDDLDIKVRYEDGTPIVQVRDGAPNETEVALRWVTCQGNEKSVFVVGTKADEDAVRPIVHDYIGGDPQHICDSEKTFREKFPEATP